MINRASLLKRVSKQCSHPRQPWPCLASSSFHGGQPLRALSTQDEEEIAVDDEAYEEIRQKNSIKPLDFYEHWAAQRRYFYYIDNQVGGLEKQRLCGRSTKRMSD